MLVVICGEIMYCKSVNIWMSFIIMKVDKKVVPYRRDVR